MDKEMEKAFNICRERDEKEMRAWLAERNVEPEAVEKIISGLKEACFALIDVSIDEKEEEITVFGSNELMMEFGFTGDIESWGRG